MCAKLMSLAERRCTVLHSKARAGVAGPEINRNENGFGHLRIRCICCNIAGQAPAIRALIRHKADVRACAKSGRTPLDVVRCVGRWIGDVRPR